MKDIIIIYHKNCLDGFASAFIAYQKFGDTAEYLPFAYDETLPELEHKQIYFLDFSCKRDQLLKLKETNNVIVIDHHKTAEKELEGIDGCIFDMSKSGCRLTWEHFNPLITEIPTYIKYIEDRDLWKFNFIESKAFCLALHSTMSFTFSCWESLKDGLTIAYLLNLGAKLLEIQEKEVNSFVKNAHTVTVAGHTGLACNVPPKYSSDLGNVLAKHTLTFGLTYYFDGFQWLYSLRSVGEFDVSEIAKQFGGGGHKNAAGFSSLSPIF